MSEHNLFSVLGKYVERQNENLLTQSLSAMFNHCPVYREDLLAIFQRQVNVKPIHTTDDCYAVTQSSRSLKHCKILVDMEIRTREDQSIKYIVEAKLTAPLSKKQAKHYAEFLKKRKGKSRLVLITMAGIDSELKQLLPKSTQWLTWTELAELAVRPASRSKSERFLCEQFNQMLEERGIPMAKNITYGEYDRLGVLDKFVAGKYRSLTKSNIETINSILARMRIFVDVGWGTLPDFGYRPYDRVFADRPSRNNDLEEACAELVVGYYLLKKRKHVHERFIYLSIECERPKLRAWCGWRLGKQHSKYESDQSGKILKEWTPAESRNLFKMSLPEAERKIQTDMDLCLKKFKKSRFYNS